jgi:hypothetical protein
MNSLVRDMMTTDVVTVEASTPFKEIVARCRAWRAWSGSRTGSPTTSTTAAATC